MKNYSLNYYINNYLKSIEQHLHTYKKNEEQESLHSLRVDIKKVKALLSFAKNMYNEKFYANELKSLFLKAGKIRVMQINICLLNSLPQFPKILVNKLKSKKSKNEKEFVENVSQYIKSVRCFREKISLPETLPDKKTIKKYFKKENQKANKKFHSKEREEMHRFRVKIKKLMYVYNTLPEKMQKAIRLNVDNINEKQKKVGKWHDTYSAINYFSKIRFSTKTSGYISKFKQKEKKQFNALFTLDR